MLIHESKPWYISPFITCPARPKLFAPVCKHIYYLHFFHQNSKHLCILITSFHRIFLLVKYHLLLSFWCKRLFGHFLSDSWVALVYTLYITVTSHEQNISIRLQQSNSLIRLGESESKYFDPWPWKGHYHQMSVRNLRTFHPAHFDLSCSYHSYSGQGAVSTPTHY